MKKQTFFLLASVTICLLIVVINLTNPWAIFCLSYVGFVTGIGIRFINDNL